MAELVFSPHDLDYDEMTVLACTIVTIGTEWRTYKLTLFRSEAPHRFFPLQASAMSIIEEFVVANDQYVANFTKGSLPLPPGRKAIVLVCMDARIDPARALGLEEGDVHVSKNLNTLS